VIYAEDDIEIVMADTEENCQRLAQVAANKVTEWYNMVGLSLNPKKSEIMGFGFNPEPVMVAGTPVQPSKAIKFLGCHIQQDLRWDKQVSQLCCQLRRVAGRIRFEGRHMDMQERRVLYNGWCTGKLLASAGAYLPLLNEGQKKSLQTACNAGIRAVMGLPRWGEFPMSMIRLHYNFDSIDELCDILIYQESWKLRPVETLQNGAMTRARARGNISLPSKKQWSGKMISTKLREAWNGLPMNIRQEMDKKRANKLIRDFVKN